MALPAGKKRHGSVEPMSDVVHAWAGAAEYVFWKSFDLSDGDRAAGMGHLSSHVAADFQATAGMSGVRGLFRKDQKAVPLAEEQMEGQKDPRVQKVSEVQKHPAPAPYQGLAHGLLPVLQQPFWSGRVTNMKKGSRRLA